jgi:hypothetical protein
VTDLHSVADAKRETLESDGFSHWRLATAKAVALHNLFSGEFDRTCTFGSTDNENGESQS